MYLPLFRVVALRAANRPLTCVSKLLAQSARLDRHTVSVGRWHVSKLQVSIFRDIPDHSLRALAMGAVLA